MVAALAAAAVVFVIAGANKPSDPTLGSAERKRVEGFGEIAYRVVGSEAGQRCALLAETSEQLATGLMGRTNLGGYDGMLFVFPEDTTGSFYMKNTRLPLSIAWFDAAGRFVSSTDMEPCLDRADCPLYSATGPYRYALEVPKGGLVPLGIGPGSAISVGGPCS
jgi:uncharacterized membrane protein (UPF0127 family)